jgi:uncharacterized protein (TIGR02145 family)
MRSLSFIALLAVLFLNSCSKKSDPEPTTDPRVGKVVIAGRTYSTIIIGNKTWTSLNYVGDEVPFAFTSTKYGNYYTLAQASAITLPAGWRIPSRADYNNLLSNYTSFKNTKNDYVGNEAVATSLADTVRFHSLNNPLNTSLKLNNVSGFTAYANGQYFITGSRVADQNQYATFLTSTVGTESSQTVNYVFAITPDNVSIGSVGSGYYAGIDFNFDPRAYSLRFVKDN